MWYERGRKMWEWASEPITKGGLVLATLILFAFYFLRGFYRGWRKHKKVKLDPKRYRISVTVKDEETRETIYGATVDHIPMEYISHEVSFANGPVYHYQIQSVIYKRVKLK